MKEAKFQADLINEIHEILPGSIVLINDPKRIQGFPDLLVLYQNKWAALECKKSLHEPFQPNQEYYLDILSRMSFASMICPENKEAVLNELQQTFKLRRPTRFSKRK